jgi:hypothetical protein
MSWYITCREPHFADNVSVFAANSFSKISFIMMPLVYVRHLHNPMKTARLVITAHYPVIIKLQANCMSRRLHSFSRLQMTGHALLANKPRHPPRCMRNAAIGYFGWSWSRRPRAGKREADENLFNELKRRCLTLSSLIERVGADDGLIMKLSLHLGFRSLNTRVVLIASFLFQATLGFVVYTRDVQTARATRPSSSRWLMLRIHWAEKPTHSPKPGLRLLPRALWCTGLRAPLP